MQFTPRALVLHVNAAKLKYLHENRHACLHKMWIIRHYCMPYILLIMRLILY